MNLRRLLYCLALASSGCVWVCSDSELYLAPWPDERLRTPDGTIDISSFPEGTGSPLRDRVVSALDGTTGFGLASAVYFPIEGPIDETLLPTPNESMREGASVFLMNVDPSSPELGRLMPIDVRFAEDGGPFGVSNLLSALPYPGVTLAADTLYAAVVTTRIVPVCVVPSSEVHRAALETLRTLNVDTSEIGSIAVFRTGDPVRPLERAVRDAPVPVLDRTPHLTEVHADYCVFASTVQMPVFQGGEPPYLTDGGAWVYAGGALQLQREEAARIFVTVPRVDRSSYPAAVFVRAGGGGDRPLIDRGPRDADGNSVPGTGLAVHIAKAGFVGVSIDGPLGGVRNLRAWDEQFVVMNAANLAALEGNVLQTALEIALTARMLDAIAFDASACEGASSEVRIDVDHVALIGHSNGATIAPLAVAVEPRYGALILSGAGASLVRQVMFKQSPLRLRSAAELMLGYPLYGAHLSEHDPMLNLLQWSSERADPLVYGRAISERTSPPHVLVFQGLLDTYIPPPVANPLNLSLDLDLAGEALDENFPEYVPMRLDLELSRGAVLELPVRANRGVTRAVVQYEEDGIEDGHEVLFQRADAHRQLRSFLESFARDSATID